MPSICSPSVLVAVDESDDPISVPSKEVNETEAITSLGKTVLMLLSNMRLLNVEEITSVLAALESERQLKWPLQRSSKERASWSEKPT